MNADSDLASTGATTSEVTSAGPATGATSDNVDRSSDEPGGRSDANACPYQGLAPFTAENTELFFGRARATADIIERLSRRLDGQGTILTVSGASGVGKSSLLRAGLIPALQKGRLPTFGSQRWRCQLMTPAGTPLRTLARRLIDVYGGRPETTYEQLRDDPRQAMAGTAVRDARLVLIVDQFEELFTLVADERERQAFIRALHAMTDGPGGAALIIGVRADYWDRCAAYPEFAEAIQDGQVIVQPMVDADLRLAITGPAAAVGLEIEPGLVETILDELAGARDGTGSYEPGALPLLSQALRNTWERREHGRLTFRGYEESGRVRDAVEHTADGVFQRLSAADRKTALRAFRRMTLITAGGQVARRPATLADIHAAVSAHSSERRAAVDALISAFADRRLLTLNEDSVEISHDALLAVWPTLRHWLAPDLAAQELYDRLIQDAQEWAEHHRDPAFLYRGGRLQSVRDARARWGRDPDSFPPPGNTVEAFVAAAKRAARQRERRRGLVLAGLAKLTILALVAAGFAVNAAADAGRQRALAVSRQLATLSEVVGDPVTSALLAAAAWQIAPTPEARYHMLDAAAEPDRAVLYGHHGAVTQLAFSPDGSVIATGGADGTVRLWDTTSRLQVGLPIVHPRGECSKGVDGVAISPDGGTLATACSRTIRFWDISTRRMLDYSLNNEDPVSAIAFSPAGGILATTSTTGTIRLWDVPAGRQRGAAFGGSASRPGPGRAITAVAFSRDGTRLATAGADHTARLWDTTTHQQVGPAFTGHTDVVQDLAFSPDGTTLATASMDGTARLWDLATHHQVGTPLKNRKKYGGLYGIAFSPDGKRLVAVRANGYTRLWDVMSHQSLDLIFPYSQMERRVAFSPDGKLLAVAGDAGVVRLVDPLSHRQVGSELRGWSAVALSPDGKTLATADPSDDSAILLWDMAAQRRSGLPAHPVARLVSGGDASVVDIKFSRDGKTIATGGADGLRLWDVGTLRRIDGPIYSGPSYPEGGGRRAKFSPDGRFLATWHNSFIQVWKIAGYRKIANRVTITRYSGSVSAMAFSPDDKTLAITGDDHAVRLFNVTTHRQIREPLPITTSGATDALAFSPDGATLAIAADDNSVRLWDIADRRQLGALVGHTDSITAIAFSPDGKALVTGSEDRTARLWDLLTYRPIGMPMTGHRDSVTDVAYSPDGTTIATVSLDKTARIWNIAIPSDANLVATTCANAGRSLTRAEWKSYIPSESFRKICQ